MQRIVKGRILVTLMLVAVASWLGVKVADAAAITNVTVAKGTKHVYVKVQGNGGLNYKIQHLPPGSDDWRNIVVDVWPAYITPGKEPKSKLEVNEGLVAQVRVRSIGGGVVRIFVDVISWPNYNVYSDGSSVTLKIDPYHMRDKNPGAMK